MSASKVRRAAYAARVYMATRPCSVSSAFIWIQFARLFAGRSTGLHLSHCIERPWCASSPMAAIPGASRNILPARVQFESQVRAWDSCTEQHAGATVKLRGGVRVALAGNLGLP